jgi:hypothetical protein
MARKVSSFRLDVELLARVDAYAKSRGASQAQVIEAALEGFLAEAEGGVPDLPVVDTPAVRLERAKRAAPVKPARQLSRADGDALSRQARLNAAASRARAK